MWQNKYGQFTDSQMQQTKESMRKQIYFLLLCVDPKTKEDYKNINVNQAFENLLCKFAGLNELLFYPVALVNIMSLLEAALIEYNSKDFNYATYRKLVLDAGSEVLKIEEV